MALTDNLVSYWKLDESSGDASDSVGSNTLTNNNSTAFATGKINNGADFESGSSNYLSSASASFDISDALTISGWINPESTPGSGTWRGIVSKYTSSFGLNSYLFWYYNNGGTPQINASISGDGSTLKTTSYNVTLTTGTWYHVAMVYIPSVSITLYLNGVQVAINTTSIPASIDVNTGIDLLVGTGEATNYFDGMIDEVGIWSRALTADEVTSLYNGGSGIQYPFSTTSIKTIDGLARASVKTVDNLAVASMKTYNGLA